MRTTLAAVFLSLFLFTGAALAQVSQEPGRDYYKPATSNLDIAGLAERIDHVLFQILNMQSANVTAFSPADRDRLNTYNVGLQGYADFVANRFLDSPQWSPQLIPINYVTVGYDPVFQNMGLRDVARLYMMLSTELTYSESNRVSTGILPADKVRFDAILSTIESFLVDYVDIVQPLDLPEFSTVQ